MSEDGKVEIWWDRHVETRRKLEDNRPDITVLDRVAWRWTFVDFSVPWDKNVVSKEDEKINNYSLLVKEITKLHRVSAKVVPLVVGCSIGGWLFGCCVMPVGAVFKRVGHSGSVQF